jgi:CubicO group peptidase (beta-lactamase class C family)
MVKIAHFSAVGYTVPHKHKGSVGLVATAENYWRFAQMLLNGGEFNGARILSPATIRYMTRDHMGNIKLELPWSGISFGLGFATVTDPASMGAVGSEGGYFFQGLANTFFSVDPKEDLIIVAMAQGPGDVWHSIRSLVYGALME